MRCHKLNDQGSSLVTVIVSIIFIAMLGMLVLSATFVNMRYKVNETKKKEAFYQCEAGLDEITSGIRQLVADCSQAGYLSVLENYKSFSGNEVMIQKQYYQECRKKFRDYLTVTGTNQIDVSKLNGYVKTSGISVEFPNTAIDSYNVTIDPSTDKTHITIQGLLVKYDKTMTGGTPPIHSEISTDIEVDFPVLKGGAIVNNVLASDPVYLDYSMIADKGINCTASSARITGNVYAGGPFLIGSGLNQSTLNMDSDCIIVKEELNVHQGSSLGVNITDFTSGDASSITTKNKQLWVGNLITSPETNMGNETRLKLGINSFVQDDLALNAKNSQVDILGNYAGYGTWNNTDPADIKSGSAIIINGNKSELQLKSGSLCLGGYAYVSVPETVSVGGSTTTVYKNEVLTGESVGIRNYQSIYLAPAECTNNGHNPAMFNEVDGSDLEDEINLGQLKTTLHIPDEALEGKGVKAIRYTPALGAEEEVYYFVNFKTPQKATSFFAAYTGEPAHSDWGEVQNTTFQAKVNIECSDIRSNGNVIQRANLDGSGSSLAMSSAFDPNVGISGEIVGTMPITFYNLYRTLKKEDVEGTDENTTPYSSYVVTGLVNNLSNQYSKKYNDTYQEVLSPGANYRYHLVVMKGDYTVDSEDRGIIIASGDVTVKSQFTGLILSGGKIILEEGGKIYRDKQLVKEALLHSKGEFLQYLGLNESTFECNNTFTGDGDKMELKKLVTYKNWNRR